MLIHSFDCKYNEHQLDEPLEAMSDLCLEPDWDLFGGSPLSSSPVETESALPSPEKDVHTYRNLKAPPKIMISDSEPLELPILETKSRLTREKWAPKIAQDPRPPTSYSRAPPTAPPDLNPPMTLSPAPDSLPLFSLPLNPIMTPHESGSPYGVLQRPSPDILSEPLPTISYARFTEY